MSKIKNLFAMNVAMLALAMNNGIVPAEKRRTPERKTITDKDRERIAKQYASEQHEYVIKGVKIVAPNKKVAIKIYNLKKKENKMKQPLQKQCNECDYYNEKQTFCNVWQKHKQANTTKCNFYQITNTKRTLNHCEPQMIMPRTDCKFCEIRIFNDIMLDNGACRSQYAVCRNPHFNEGCEIIDFRLLDNPYSVRCQNCKEYIPINGQKNTNQ